MKEHPLTIEREAKTRAARTIGTPGWAGLMPVGIAALGPPSQPVARLMGAQSAVYRLIVMLGSLSLPRAGEPAAEATNRQPDTPTRA
jgi:hypothetical protein